MSLLHHPNRYIAKEKAETYYKPDKQCAKGHSPFRFTSNGHCVECTYINKAKYRLTENGKKKEKEYMKNYEWKGKLKTRVRLYDITLEQYNEMLQAQNGVCKICKEPPNIKGPKGKIKDLCIDHCHDTNKVRGLLCHSCNAAIGLLKHSSDLLKIAALYCEETKGCPEYKGIV